MNLWKPHDGDSQAYYMYPHRILITLSLWEMTQQWMTGVGVFGGSHDIGGPPCGESDLFRGGRPACNTPFRYRCDSAIATS
jgi:hypothetical protein